MDDMVNVKVEVIRQWRRIIARRSRQARQPVGAVARGGSARWAEKRLWVPTPD
jgi:hypothetical protein